MISQLKKIVCPVDFSEFSELALIQAVEIAKQSGAKLALLTVAQPDVPVQLGDSMMFTEIRPLSVVPEEAAKEQLTSLRDKHCAAVLEQTTLTVVTGVPFVEIVRFARDFDADLIVMGSHGRTGIEHLLIGSVAERVVRKSACSVLVVRDAKHRFVMP